MDVHYEFADENNDGLVDCVMVLSKDYAAEPLIGDYRGMRLAIIPFSNDEGKRRAEELARIYCAALKDMPNYNGGER